MVFDNEYIYILKKKKNVGENVGNHSIITRKPKKVKFETL